MFFFFIMLRPVLPFFLFLLLFLRDSTPSHCTYRRCIPFGRSTGSFSLTAQSRHLTPWPVSVLPALRTLQSTWRTTTILASTIRRLLDLIKVESECATSLTFPSVLIIPISFVSCSVWVVFYTVRWYLCGSPPTFCSQNINHLFFLYCHVTFLAPHTSFCTL